MAYRNSEGYISRRQQRKGKCQLCGKSCRKRTTIINRINGKELKICNECMQKYQFKNVTDLDTKTKESEVVSNGR